MGKQIGKLTFCLMVWLIMATLVLHVQAATQILINIPSRTLELYQDNALIKEYPVAIGKPATPTPAGEFAVIDKETDPTWYPPGKKYIVPPGPDNPLGSRWMGTGGLYGIHGTNAPWSIGLAVSNGCVRMQDADAQELFDLVGYDTAVKIEYERVKVRVDRQGQASIGIYADVYGRQAITLADVKAALKQAGLEGLADDVFLQGLIRDVPDRQVMFAQLHDLKINGMLRPERVLARGGKKHVPILALAQSLHISVEWNENSRAVSRQGTIVPAIKYGNTVYVASDHLPRLFAGRQLWNDEQNVLELLLPVAQFDGQLLSGDIQSVDGSYAIPALAVAEALRERVVWRPGIGQLMVHGRSVPIKLIGGQPFIMINHLGAVYNMAAVWDEQTQVVSLTYPWQPIDYSMYLDPGAEYL